jgi:hypothetical protein
VSAARVLRGVLEGFEATEVDRRFDFRRVPPDALRVDRHIERAAAGRRTQSGSKTAVDQKRRVYTVGQIAQLLNGLLHIASQGVEHLGRSSRIAGQEIARQAEAHRQSDQVLLGAVVKVSLDSAPFGISGGDDAGPGLA